MEIKVDIRLDNATLMALGRAKSEALEQTVEAVLSDIKTSAVVPKDTGMLEDSGFTEIEEMVASVIFDTPYARRLYWHPEYNFRTDKNPNAGGLWLESYLTGEKRQWVINTYSTFLKQLSGGIIS